MSSRRLGFSFALLLVAPALAALAAEKDNYGDPLPDGAKARIGTARLRGMGYSAPVLSPDGKAIYTNSAAGLVKLDPATGAKLGKAPVQLYGALTGFSADGTRALHTTQYDRAIVWDTASGKTLVKIERPLPGTDHAVALSADGKFLAVGGTAGREKKAPVTVLMWNVSDDKEVKSITVPQSESSYVAISSDGKTLANWGYHVFDPNAKPADRDDSPSRFVYFWDTATGKEVSRFRAPEFTPPAVVFAPNGALAAVSSINTIDLVDPKTGTSKHRLLGRTRVGRFITFSPDGATVAATGDDGAVQRWRVSDGARLSTTEAPTANVTNTRVKLFDNEKGVAWGTKGMATLVWEVPGGTFVGPEGGHTGAVRGVAVTGDGKHVLTSSDDGLAMRWELATGKPAGEVPLKRPNAGFAGYSPGAIFSADATKALVPDAGVGVALYDVATGVQQYAIPVPQDGGAAQGTFSADGSKVVVSSASNYDFKKKPARATVWDAATSKSLGAVELPGYSQLTAAVTPDGKHLITAGLKPAEKGPGAFVVTGWELATGAKKGEFTDQGQRVLITL